LSQFEVRPFTPMLCDAKRLTLTSSLRVQRSLSKGMHGPPHYKLERLRPGPL